ncbi:MAG: hypothetical protein H6877_11225 [Rhodobiaceae bacterium]|nr:hypothetical protein [Rhodobiaceae bacterium]
MRDGLEKGRAPRATALEIVGRVNKTTGKREGGFIGLTSQQAEYALSAREELLSGDPKLLRHYLTRELRDKRFDRLIMKVIDGRETITAADAAKIVGRYKDKMLKFRGDMIARTESLTALRAGRHEGYAQLLDSGTVTEDQIERTWDATGDKRTRLDHLAMEGQKVRGLSAPFVAPDGSQLMFPGDTSLGAPGAQTIACRCIEKVRIRYL